MLGLWTVNASAQVVLGDTHNEFRVEGFANLTLGVPDSGDMNSSTSAGDLRLDAAVRLLGRRSLGEHSGIGARVVIESSPEKNLGIGEASAILFGDWGRLEIGRRMGLPDVLSGYAPNEFTFTTAAFGPYSGPSLEPAGDLQTAFLDRTLAARIKSLSSLGFSASLADDESNKVVYVAPRTHGFIAGLSYSADPQDSRFMRLFQSGLVREWYWAQNELRIGGSYTFAQGRPGIQAVRDLQSLNLGVSATIDDDWSIGASVTYNGTSGLPNVVASNHHLAAAVGATVSVNYNTGPWTFGGYYQWASNEGDVQIAGSDRLQVLELGASYRWSTHWRLYSAAYRYDLSETSGQLSTSPQRGTVWLLGIRAAL